MWLDRLECEYANLRAAIVHVVDHGGPDEDVLVALDITAIAWPLWDIRGHHREAREWLERLLALPAASAATEHRARGLDASGWLAYGLGDVVSAQERLKEAYELWSRLGHRHALAWSAAMQGLVVFNLGDASPATRLFELARATGEETGDDLLANWAVFGLVHIQLLAGDLEAARLQLEAFLPVLGPDRLRFGPAAAAFGLFSLGQIALLAGDLTRAASLTRECLQFRWAARDLRALPETLEARAVLARAVGSHERSARLFGAGEAARQLTGVQLLPWLRDQRDQSLVFVREQLGTSRFDELWSEGVNMPLERSVEYALAEPDATDAGVPHVDYGRALLSRREREVAAMVARGMTNREIAAELVISERTAEAHVEHIRRKLNASSRGQVAVWAAVHGMIGTTPIRL